ncbi:S24 family peptidase [Bacteroides sp. AN502(2024)]|uniref:S24 family peptidase n=1 Tax=Bacteroides sp. AN502(2024) TaxID=3160599 RepID=UPI003518D8D1
MGTILSRIQEIATEEGITIGALERQIGASKGVLSRAINNGTDIQSKWIQTIVENYPRYSPRWLMTGRGEMFDKEPTAPTKQQPTIADERPVASPATKPGDGIPLIPIEAMAGALTSEQTVLEYECERYVVPMFKGADFLIPVKGSSMYPKYSSGDIVACQRVPMSDLFFQWNKVYVIDTNQGALIKRIKPGSDKDHVLIVSDNEKYDPFELPYSAIHAVALVIGVIRLE